MGATLRRLGCSACTGTCSCSTTGNTITFTVVYGGPEPTAAATWGGATYAAERASVFFDVAWIGARVHREFMRALVGDGRNEGVARVLDRRPIARATQWLAHVARRRF